MYSLAKSQKFSCYAKTYITFPVIIYAIYIGFHIRNVQFVDLRQNVSRHSVHIPLEEDGMG